MAFIALFLILYSKLFFLVATYGKLYFFKIFFCNFGTGLKFDGPHGYKYDHIQCFPFSIERIQSIFYSSAGACMFTKNPCKF